MSENLRLKDIVDATEAAAIMGVTRGRINQIVNDGRLRVVKKYPKILFFKRKDIEKLRDELVPRRPRSGGRKARLEAKAKALKEAADMLVDL
jgi:predicted site-specific integrase-resolvase